jgi:hypothetical protein
MPSRRSPAVLAIMWMVLGVALAVGADSLERSRPPASPPAGAALPSWVPKLDDRQPLVPIVAWAKQTAVRVEKDIHDYSAILAKRDTVGAKEPEYVFVKVRHQPFSVYAYVLTPPNKAGNEGIYVEGRNDGKLVGHSTGWLGKISGTVFLDPAGALAMDGHRHPITETGILNLMGQILSFTEKNVQQTGCTVDAIPGASVNDRKATCIRVCFPSGTPGVKAYLIRVFVDDDLQFPIRYESYEWPQTAGATPVLKEEFTYLDVKLNQGFTDADFDPKNKNYAFP